MIRSDLQPNASLYCDAFQPMRSAQKAHIECHLGLMHITPWLGSHSTESASKKTPPGALNSFNCIRHSCGTKRRSPDAYRNVELSGVFDCLWRKVFTPSISGRRRSPLELLILSLPQPQLGGVESSENSHVIQVMRKSAAMLCCEYTHNHIV